MTDRTDLIFLTRLQEQITQCEESKMYFSESRLDSGQWIHLRTWFSQVISLKSTQDLITVTAQPGVFFQQKTSNFGHIWDIKS